MELGRFSGAVDTILPALKVIFVLGTPESVLPQLKLDEFIENAPDAVA